jgi:glycosyltransferase involved in cell wall biosynthesis
VSGSGASGRVTMFVTNDLRRDSRVRREAATLAAAGFEVVVMALGTDATAATPVEALDGFTVVRTPMPTRSSRGQVSVPRRWRSPRAVVRRLASFLYRRLAPLMGDSVRYAIGWQFRWRRWARHVLDGVRPSDVWHAHDLNTLQLALDCARRYGGRVIYDSHEIFSEAGLAARLPSVTRRTLRRFERRWARRCDAVITVNESVADVLRRSLGVARVDVVHNCADPPAFASPLRERMEAPASAPLILYHGSLATGRGVEALVRALGDERLQDARLAIMGYGPLEEELGELAAALGLGDRVRLLEPVRPADLTSWVAGADVAAVPIEPTTLNHRLSSPNKLFEAIAAGVPVVGPDFVEFRRIVLDPDLGPLGVLYADHGPDGIAGAIAQLLEAPEEERAALRDRVARAAAERWNWDREGQRLLAVYESIGVKP